MEQGSAALADPPVAPEAETEAEPTPEAQRVARIRVQFVSGNTTDYTDTVTDLEQKLHQVYGTGDGVLLRMTPAVGGGEPELVNVSNVEKFKPLTP